MKRITLFTLALASLVAASCSIKEDRIACSAPVTVHVNDFLITVDSFADTKATNPNSYSTVKALTLAFFNSGTNEKIFFQSHYKPSEGTDPNFSTFSCNLPFGSFTMVVLGYDFYDGDVLELSSPTAAAFTSDKPRETFCYTQSVTISSGDPVDLSATLDRIVTRLTVNSTDGRTAAATNIRIGLEKGSKAFNPTTGFATSNGGFSVTLSLPVSEGQTSRSTIFAFLAQETETMDVTLDVLNEGGEVIQTHNVANVPFQINHATTLRGPIFSTPSPSTGTFQLNTDYLGEELVNF